MNDFVSTQWLQLAGLATMTSLVLSSCAKLLRGTICAIPQVIGFRRSRGDRPRPDAFGGRMMRQR